MKNSLRDYLFTEHSQSLESVASLALTSILDNFTDTVSDKIFSELCNYARSIVAQDDEVANFTIWEARVRQEFYRLVNNFTANTMQS